MEEFFHSLTAGRIIFILGVVNIVTAILIAGSCRCVPGSKLLGKFTKFPAYQRFYGYHCHIWKIFWPSIIIHAFLALMFFGWPG
jgi:hypothetical protein